MERALVGKVGHPVAGRPGEGRPVPADDVAAAEDVEERDSGHQAATADEQERPPHGRELGVERGVVIRHLVGVPAGRELHRGDELEVARVELRVALVAGVGIARPDHVCDPRIGVDRPDDARISGGEDPAVLVEHLRLEGPWTLRQDVEYGVDLDQRRGCRQAATADRLEDLDVALLHRRVLRDLGAAGVAVDDYEADELDHRDRRDEAHEEAQREAQIAVRISGRRGAPGPRSDHGYRRFRRRRHGPRDRPSLVPLNTAKRVFVLE